MLLQSLIESINDKGLFKALFIVGMPYAGKSYTVSEITGEISPRIVNTDKPLEHLAKMKGIDLDAELEDSILKPLVNKSKILNSKMLINYIDSMLPLIVDGTSADISNILQRIGTLQYFGYDVGIVFVNVDLETALNRRETSDRKRKVPVEFIKFVGSKYEEDKEYLKKNIRDVYELDNNDVLTDNVIKKLFLHAQDFYNAPLENPIGNRHIKKLKGTNGKYLHDILDETEIKNRVVTWYRT